MGGGEVRKRERERERKKGDRQMSRGAMTLICTFVLCRKNEEM